MIIRTLQLTNFRNLQTQEIDCHPKFNVISGQNASGKTSFLEALYFLSRTRSFRCNDVRKLIQYDAQFLRIIATLQALDEDLISNNSDDQTHALINRLGIEQSVDQTQIKYNGEFINKKSELAKLLPILFLGPDTQALLSDSPKFRRKFLDWGLFHSDPNYQRVWMRYERLLKQRNAALKKNLTDRVLNSIDHELIENGNYINEARAKFCTALLTQAQNLICLFIKQDVEVEIIFRKGYQGAFSENLQHSRAGDRIMGFTRSGPHRADFMLKINQKPAIEYLSRGQLKLATIALILSQLKLHQQLTHKSSILLLDDISAELDRARRETLLDGLLSLNSQLFVTVLEKNEFPEVFDLKSKNLIQEITLQDGILKRML